jgi:hypothetical protein
MSIARPLVGISSERIFDALAEFSQVIVDGHQTGQELSLPCSFEFFDGMRFEDVKTVGLYLLYKLHAMCLCDSWTVHERTQAVIDVTPCSYSVAKIVVEYSMEYQFITIPSLNVPVCSRNAYSKAGLCMCDSD